MASRFSSASCKSIDLAEPHPTFPLFLHQNFPQHTRQISFGVVVACEQGVRALTHSSSSSVLLLPSGEYRHPFSQSPSPACTTLCNIAPQPAARRGSVPDPCPSINGVSTASTTLLLPFSLRSGSPDACTTSLHHPLHLSNGLTCVRAPMSGWRGRQHMPTLSSPSSEAQPTCRFDRVPCCFVPPTLLFAI